MTKQPIVNKSGNAQLKNKIKHKHKTNNASRSPQQIYKLYMILEAAYDGQNDQ